VMGRGASPLIYDTSTKVNPPLRSRMDIEALIQGIRDNVIDAIATDHAPHTLVDKLCEYDTAAFGISVFETALASLMSMVHQGKLELAAIVSKLACEPAGIIGRGSQIGTLKAGAMGDVTIFDPNAEWQVDTSQFVSRGKHTPLDGCVLKGKVVATVVGGEVVYKDKSLKLEKMGESRA
ncbi:MAG: amidohydrolase family protein, partial [Chloroflexi bacterium]|nr:amidohydrolase family protein [Chloroflexota bacterium]